LSCKKNTLRGARSGDSILQVNEGSGVSVNGTTGGQAKAANVITILYLDEIFLSMGAQVAIQNLLSTISLSFELIEETKPNTMSFLCRLNLIRLGSLYIYVQLLMSTEWAKSRD